jgi:uncharacterized protein
VVIETVVTTRDEGGGVNFAAMGVVWGDDAITIRPFTNTRTYRNLVRTRVAVVNVTDNVLIFAKSALSREGFDTMPAQRVDGDVLKDACLWREVTVERIVEPATEDGSPGGLPPGAPRLLSAGTPRRAEVVTRVVGGGELRPFIGLCRAKHAVVEASILGSRLNLIPLVDVMRELDRLDGLVEKTGGADERDAMTFIRAHVARRVARS